MHEENVGSIGLAGNNHQMYEVRYVSTRPVLFEGPLTVGFPSIHSSVFNAVRPFDKGR